MIYSGRMTHRWAGHRLRRALSGLLVACLLLALAPVGHVAADTGTTLAVTRAAGATLYDDTGAVLRELPSGVAFKVSGRTADSRWFYGATRDGATGWMSADEVLIFGVSKVAERAGFTPPAGPATAPATGSAAGTETSTADAQPAAETATASAAGASATATVSTGAQRLNVRSGPGTSYPVVGSLASGSQVTATARSARGDWLRIADANLPAGTGWASAAYLTVQGNATELPVAGAPAAAAASAQPGQAAARTTSNRQPATSTGQPAPPAAGLTGKLVFQARSGGQLYIYDLARGTLRELTSGADPALSPDGRTVVFWRADGGSHSLYLIDSDGGNERRILTRSEALRAPAWSPDGSKIVFSHISGQRKCRDVGYNICMPDVFPYNLMFPLKVADAWGLARVDREGGSYQDIAAVPDAISPDWSDRGILYGGTGIQLTQDGSAADQNRSLLGEFHYQDPASQPGGGPPDGGRIVFHSLEKDHWEIFSANADGSNVVALTRPETTLVDVLPHNVAPDWSPDGRHIVFLSNRTGRWQLWVMEADGANLRALPVDVPIEYNYQAEQVVSWGQ